MTCDMCNENHWSVNNNLYECSCCRSNICKKCCIDGNYLLCKSCSNKEDLTEEDMFSWLVKCEKCGNMWDGNAQCNCWEYDFKLAFESDSDTDSEEKDTDLDNEYEYEDEYEDYSSASKHLVKTKM